MQQLWKWRKPFNKRNRVLEKTRFEALLRCLPSPSIKVYTDGSSFGNPGPAGAGYVIEDSNGNYVVQHSRHLGVASNNSAEIDALLDSTDKVRNTKKISPETPVFFFVDSSETIRLATGRAVARKWCVDRVHRIKENLKQIGQQRRTAVCWVPGHADIPGNEAADAVAKRGAAGFTGYGKIQSDHPTRPESIPRNTYGTESKQEPYENMLARVKD